IDQAHTKLSFVARYLMVTKVRGRFADFEGMLHIGETPEQSSVEVSIDAASIQTDNETRDEHLRSPDFLAVERFPKLTFKSTKVEQTGDTSLRVTGDLTIRDVTRPVVLDAEFEGTTKGMRGDTRVGFSASTRRSTFPTTVSGSVARNSTKLGTLYAASPDSSFRQKSRISSGVEAIPSLSTM